MPTLGQASSVTTEPAPDGPNWRPVGTPSILEPCQGQMLGLVESSSSVVTYPLSLKRRMFSWLLNCSDVRLEIRIGSSALLYLSLRGKSYSSLYAVGRVTEVLPIHGTRFDISWWKRLAEASNPNKITVVRLIAIAAPFQLAKLIRRLRPLYGS